ncbi:MAG TPA: ABC transporter permease [Ruminococcaceae bacterium]|jgi:putative ABC transport system permease protein|nr:ABC transporter permease [Oscillospiraceae bacterium]HBN80265.1 ABC transporter permease [Oscillospiraceae bacterium]
MKQAPLSIRRLSVCNLKRRPFRTACHIAVVAVLAFVLFGGSILSVSLKNGTRSIQERFGADLIIVPQNYDKSMESILLKGEPNYFYFDQAIADQAARQEGVSRISTQFFLITLKADCCSVPIQLVGFHPETDFTIQPWISQKYGRDLEDGQLVVGSDVADSGRKSLTFFNRQYPIAARLEKTGTGLDASVFTNMNTIRSLFQGAKAAGMGFLSGTDPEKSISSVLVKIDSHYDADTVAHNIRSHISGVQVIKTRSMFTGISNTLGSLPVFLYAISIALWVLAAAVLTVMFSVTANERKKEFAVLRILGATRKKLAGILLNESLFASMAGGIIGVAAAAAVVFPFNVYIGDRLGLPYLQPQISVVLGILALSLFLSFLVGPLASAHSAIKISRAETYLTMREGE